MLKMILILAFGLVSVTGRSQSILDLTEQLAFDVEKLHSMKSTLQEMYDGYTELKTGYTHIRDIARDNFNLHKAFLDALWVVHPAVRDDPRLDEILNTTARIVGNWRSATARLGGNPVFTAQERGYITSTLSALLNRCSQALEELAMVTTDDELRMSDAQRLVSLDRIDAEVRSEAAFLQQFNNSLAVEAARRQREAGDINTLKKLYGLPD
ncbi:TerB family tellurite resistance protein [Puia dinghuensis]|uniref:TerB family tellurite resistance protein n=1 Tax=Puia dinghuensis TaxID=1792502 RepID=A0A8J2UIT3_9BACT|nr:TerB family tellurite resistance protein [Puia dinghuensis]GGB23886.1 hypothetical protein GCM10011511_54720 [Puia dinghuensis]